MMNPKRLIMSIQIILLALGMLSCAPSGIDTPINTEVITILSQTTSPELMTKVTAPKTLKIAISEWEPYTGETIKDQGLLSALVVAAFENVGYKTEMTVLPWTRCLSMTSSGAMDGVVGLSYTKERSESLSYSEVIWTSQLVFFSAQGKDVAYTSLKDLAPAKIGIFNGSYLIKDFEGIEGITLVKVDTVEQNIQMLSSGRVNYIIDTKDAIHYLLNTKLKAEATKIQIVEPPYATDQLHMAFSKQNTDYKSITEDFNQGLAAIKANGTYDRIVSDFGLK